MAQDYYKILGVERNATDEELKKAYKKAALLYHPDRQQGKSEEEKKKAEETFKEVNEAYHILSDKEKRRQYDTFGTVDGNFTNADDAMAEFMRHFHGFSGFGSFGGFDDFFGGRQERVAKGSTIQVNVTLTLGELFKRGKKTIRYDRYMPCKHCNGTGSSDRQTTTCPNCRGTGYVTVTQRNGFSIMQQTTECPHCHGKGKIVKSPCSHCGGRGLQRETQSYTFDIPMGVTDNTYTTVPQMGNAPEGGVGVNGDLKIVFRINCERGYTIDPRNPYNIIYEQEVPILDCITGCEKTIKYVDGKEFKYTISPGAVDGKRINLRNKGLCDIQGNCGVLSIIIRQKMPKSLTKESLENINKLKQKKEFK